MERSKRGENMVLVWKKELDMERDKRRIVETERQERLLALAEEFQRKMIIKQFGFRPWRKLMSKSQEKQLRAKTEFDLRTKRFYDSCRLNSYYGLHLGRSWSVGWGL